MNDRDTGVIVAGSAASWFVAKDVPQFGVMQMAASAIDPSWFENSMSDDPKEERFARQDSGPYSGWSSAFVVAVTVIVLSVFLVYYPK